MLKLDCGFVFHCPYLSCFLRLSCATSSLSCDTPTCCRTQIFVGTAHTSVFPAQHSEFGTTLNIKHAEVSYSEQYWRNTTLRPTGGATYPTQEVSDDDESESFRQFVLVHAGSRCTGHGPHLRLDRHEDRQVPAKSGSETVLAGISTE